MLIYVILLKYFNDTEEKGKHNKSTVSAIDARCIKNLWDFYS